LFTCAEVPYCVNKSRHTTDFTTVVPEFFRAFK
jgi:hypothetical protein